MKKVLIPLFSALLIAAFLFWFFHLDTIGVVCLEDKSDIKYFSSDGRPYCVVSGSGDCYIGGDTLEKDENFGVENIRKFNNNFSVNLIEPDYVRIYDKGDAVFAEVTQYGGAIITENNDVYVFINGHEGYRTPTYLCTGYVSAIVGKNSRVYLLSQNGVLEYIDVNSPDNKHFIGENIRKFNCEVKDDFFSIFALTNDEDLYIINPDEQIENNEKYLSGIKDFDILVPHEDLCVFGYVNTEGEAYMLHENIDISYDAFTNESAYIKTGENVCSVTAYDSGLAMSDDKGNLSLYGDDFHRSDSYPEFDGEVVFTDVKAAFGGYRVLAILKNNGEFYQYGSQVDPSTKKDITPE